MEEEGIWRTVGGKRIFIKDGQSLDEAMKQSGKFNIKKDELKDKKSISLGKSTLSEELNDTDKEVLDYYVMDAGAYDVNYALRNNDITPNDKRTINDLDNIFKKSQIDQDITVERYLTNDEFIRNMKVGDSYTEKGYFSTTLDSNSDRESNYMDYKSKLIINAPKGTKAIDVSPIYNEKAFEGSEENEVIFNRGQTLKLKSIDYQIGSKLYSQMNDSEKKGVTPKYGNMIYDRRIYEFEITK